MPPGTEQAKSPNAVLPWRAWWALVFIIAMMGLIIGLGPYETFELQPRRFTFDYPWKLPDPTIWTRTVVWTLYGLHQLGIWYLIYKAQHSNLKYIRGLHSVNVQALLLNAVFVLAHIFQARWTYDGLAQDVPEVTALASVALMLFFVMIMENDRRGMFFGRKALVPPGVGEVVRKYHGYYFAWAITYTFWYHPISTTPGHLMGFFYMFMLFVQGSLFMTRAHVNRWWTLSLELMMVFHGATVAWFAAAGQGQHAWAQFLFGGFAIFLVTQMFGVPLKRWHMWALTFVMVAPAVVYYSIYPVAIKDLPSIAVSRYVFVVILAGLIWLVMRPFVTKRAAPTPSRINPE